MSVISVVWRDCQQLLETYNDEQVSLACQQRMEINVLCEEKISHMVTLSRQHENSQLAYNVV